MPLTHCNWTIYFYPTHSEHNFYYIKYLGGNKFLFDEMKIMSVLYYTVNNIFILLNHSPLRHNYYPDAGESIFDLIPYNPAWSSKKWFYNLGFEPSGDWTCYLPHSRNANHLTMFNIYWDIFFRIWIKVKYIYEIAFIFTSTLVLLVITFWICKKIL